MFVFLFFWLSAAVPVYAYLGYPLLLVDETILLGQDFGFVILDEAQTIKNPQAKVSQVAQALRAEHRLCLSGTPMENHLGDLWSLFNFVQPGLLGERRQFQRLYRTPIENGGDVTVKNDADRKIPDKLATLNRLVTVERTPQKRRTASADQIHRCDCAQLANLLSVVIQPRSARDSASPEAR